MPSHPNYELNGVKNALTELTNALAAQSSDLGEAETTSLTESIQELESRCARLENAEASDPSVRFFALQQSWFDVDASVTRAAAEALVKGVAELAPAATYVRLLPGDQDASHGFEFDAFFDSDGNEIDVITDENETQFDGLWDFRSWLPHSGRGWDHLHVLENAWPGDGVLFRGRPVLKLR